MLHNADDRPVLRIDLARSAFAHNMLRSARTEAAGAVAHWRAWAWEAMAYAFSHIAAGELGQARHSFGECAYCLKEMFGAQQLVRDIDDRIEQEGI